MDYKKNYKYEDALILSQEKISTGIYSMWIETEAYENARPGQFINLYVGNPSMLLPRPISICEVDKEKKALRIVYRVAGKGTGEMKEMMAGDEIRILGPLGNGYTLPKESKKCLLMAGGIGIPPMIELAKQLNLTTSCEINFVVGYRDKIFLMEELEKYGSVYISTEDGSVGTKGNVLDAVKENNLTGDIIYSCGPMPMLRAVAKYAMDNDIEAYVSMEERMACGIGACLGCVTKTKEIDEHSQVKNTRICTDGPVFDVRKVEL